MSALDRFKAFDWESDEAWRAHLGNLELPPRRPDLLVRARAKWYRREHAPDLDVDAAAPLVAAVAAPPPAAAAPPPRKAAAAAAPPRAAPPPRTAAAAAPAARLAPLDALLLAAHLYLVAMVLCALQPFDARLSFLCYGRACRASILVHAVRLFRGLGAPRAPIAAYGRRLMAAPETFYLVTSIAASNNPRVWLILVSPTIAALYEASAAAQRALGGVPAWERSGGAAARWLAARRPAAAGRMAQAEVLALAQSALSALRAGPRGLLGTYMYANQLRFRFWAPDARPHHVAAWRAVGALAEPLLKAVPALRRAAQAGVDWFNAPAAQARHHQA